MESNSKRFGNKSESEIDAEIFQKIQRKFEIMCGGNSQFFLAEMNYKLDESTSPALINRMSNLEFFCMENL
jgi:hypothetical protein